MKSLGTRIDDSLIDTASTFLVNAVITISTFFLNSVCISVISTAVCVCVCVLVTHSYLTVCYPMDYSSPGSSVHGILRPEYWSGLPCPSPGHLPNPEIESVSSVMQANSLPSEPFI